jgi:hypothetical protein
MDQSLPAHDDLSRQVFSSVEHFMTSYNESTIAKKRNECDQPEMALLDIREQMYGILDNMRGYWSQFGFMDLSSSKDLRNAVNTMTRHVQLNEAVGDQEHDDPDCETIK